MVLLKQFTSLVSGIITHSGCFLLCLGCMSLYFEHAHEILCNISVFELRCPLRQKSSKVGLVDFSIYMYKTFIYQQITGCTILISPASKSVVRALTAQACGTGFDFRRLQVFLLSSYLPHNTTDLCAYFQLRLVRTTHLLWQMRTRLISVHVLPQILPA